MIWNFQEEATWRVQHSAEDERAEDEDGPEAGAVCLHLQMSPRRNQKPGGGGRILWSLSHWYFDKIFTRPYQVSFTKTLTLCQFIISRACKIKVLNVSIQEFKKNVYILSLDSQYIYLFMTIWSVSDFVFRLLQLIIFVFVLSDNSILRDELESDSEGEDVTSSSDLG